MSIKDGSYKDQYRWEGGFENALRDVRASFWPYFQFYGNSFAGCLLVYAAHFWVSGWSVPAAVAFLIVEGLLMYNARFSLNRFIDRRDDLVIQWEGHHPSAARPPAPPPDGPSGSTDEPMAQESAGSASA